MFDFSLFPRASVSEPKTVLLSFVTWVILSRFTSGIPLWVCVWILLYSTSKYFLKTTAKILTHFHVYIFSYFPMAFRMGVQNGTFKFHNLLLPIYSQQKINNTEYIKLRIYKMYLPLCLSFVPFNWFIKWFCWMRWRGTSKSMTVPSIIK